jgi:hypothetical protein
MVRKGYAPGWIARCPRCPYQVYLQGASLAVDGGERVSATPRFWLTQRKRAPRREGAGLAHDNPKPIAATARWVAVKRNTQSRRALWV